MFKIVPVINEKGLRYIVNEYKVAFWSWGACKKIGYLSDNGCVDTFCGPVLFNNIQEAVDFIKKKRGECAEILTWRPE